VTTVIDKNKPLNRGGDVKAHYLSWGSWWFGMSWKLFNPMDQSFECALKIDMWEIMFCPYVSMWAMG